MAEVCVCRRGTDSRIRGGTFRDREHRPISERQRNLDQSYRSSAGKLDRALLRRTQTNIPTCTTYSSSTSYTQTILAHRVLHGGTGYCCCCPMAFVPLLIADWRPAGLLRKIGNDIITLVASVFRERRTLLPFFFIPTSKPNASAAPGGRTSTQQPHHHLKPLFPLTQLSEDVCLNVLSFLPAMELSSVRGVNADFLQTTD